MLEMVKDDLGVDMNFTNTQHNIPMRQSAIIEQSKKDFELLTTVCHIRQSHRS